MFATPLDQNHALFTGLVSNILEKRRKFTDDARTAEKEVADTGQAYHAGDVHRYIRAHAGGTKGASPKPVKM